jgi:hypothetical protein
MTTGVVLALAGLACGDGGPGMGAATARAAPALTGEWEGHPVLWFWFDGPPVGYIAVELVAVLGPSRVVIYSTNERGAVCAAVDGRPCLGLCEMSAGCVLLCVGAAPGAWPHKVGPEDRTETYVLKPAAPRKP